VDTLYIYIYTKGYFGNRLSIHIYIYECTQTYTKTCIRKPTTIVYTYKNNYMYMNYTYIHNYILYKKGIHIHKYTNTNTQEHTQKECGRRREKTRERERERGQSTQTAYAQAGFLSSHLALCFMWGMVSGVHKKLEETKPQCCILGKQWPRHKGMHEYFIEYNISKEMPKPSLRMYT